MLASPALAARILVLTTNGTDADSIYLRQQCTQEFQSSGATTVDVWPGDLGADTLTAADLAPAGVSYDIVAVCVFLKSASANNILLIENAARTRAAQAFFLFDERPVASFANLIQGAKSGWTLNLAGMTGGGASTILNLSSPYHADFAALNPLASNEVTLYSGVPVDNALYLPPGAPTPAPNSTVTATSIFVPQTESYPDGSNVPQGACLFYTGDGGIFRYASNLGGKIAQAALNAIKPGSGACFMAPAAPFGAAVPVGSKGWLLTLAALLTMMTALGLHNRRA
jgi:hypothetical protein